MSLQIRVKHALGQRVIELPDRSIDQPIVVGRSSSAQVQVPSVTVAPKHCVLFVHEGRWAVQDMGRGGTLVNGKAVEGAALLQIGDVIQIGTAAGSPTIEVDPAAAAAGKTGAAGARAAKPKATTTRPPAAKAPPAAAGAYAAYPAAAPTPAAPPAYAPPQPYAQPAAVPHYGAPMPAHQGYEAAPEEAYVPDEISYTPTVTSSYPRYKKKQGNGGMIAVMIIATLMIGGVVAWVIYRDKNQPVPVAQKPEVIIIKKEAATKPATKPTEPVVAKTPASKPANAAVVDPRMTQANADDDAASTLPSRPPEPETVIPGITPSVAKTGSKTMGDEEKPKEAKPEMARKPVVPGEMAKGDDDAKPDMAPAAKPEPPKPTGPDAENPTPEMLASWEGIKKMAEMPGKESFAVFRLEEFRKANPSKYDKEIDAYIDQKMERLWWERIAHLFGKLETLKTSIDQTQLEVFDENNPDIKKQKMDSIKKMKTDLEASNKMLRETMAYDDVKPPNLDSSSELEALAQKRDKGRFEGWKKSTLFLIKNNQGKLPWANE